MTLLPALDERLQGAFDLYPHCNTGVDIGCDHGHLPLHLLVKNRCNNMILTDISPKALRKGQQLMENYQLTSRSQCLVGNGLSPLTQKVDALSILGMGGNTICQILLAHPEKLKQADLILSAHTQTDKIRAVLPTLGYRLVNEAVIKANRRYYVLMKAQPGTAAYSQKELLLGPLLLQKKDEKTLAYWQWQQQVFKKALLGQEQSTTPLTKEKQFAKTYLRYLEEVCL